MMAPSIDVLPILGHTDTKRHWKETTTVVIEESPICRIEHDAFGPVQIPVDKYWGAQTQRALLVFGVVGQERLPRSLIQAFGLQKQAAAKANHRLGCLEESSMNAIVVAAQDVQAGMFDQHFPLPVWQTGSGTQTNMNVNEVVANRANEILQRRDSKMPQWRASLGTKSPVHPNDHVNRSQSSNDTFPTVMHVGTLLQLRDRLIPSMKLLKETFRRKADDFADAIKIGRTHLMDAVPMTMGQTFDAFARQIAHHVDRIRGTFERLRELPQGGTAVGSGLNTPAGFDVLFCEELNTMTRPAPEDDDNHVEAKDTHFVPAASKFESMGCHDALVEVSGVLNGIATSILKMATDLRFLGSGPRGGLGELIFPHDGLTSSIMPGKQNPTLAEMISQVAFQVMGNHTTVSVAAAAGGHFELNVAKPVIIFNLLQSIDLLTNAIPTFATTLVQGLTVNEKTLRRNVEHSLLLPTALNPHIGYDKVSQIVKKAMADDLAPREAALSLGLVSADEYDRLCDPRTMLGPVAEIRRESPRTNGHF